MMVHEYINKLLEPFFKIRQSKIALNQTLTLKIGVTLVLTGNPGQCVMILLTPPPPPPQETSRHFNERRSRIEAAQNCAMK